MSAFVIIYMVLFSKVVLPNGEDTAVQVMLIQKYGSIEECQKSVEKTARWLSLTPEQKDDLGCIRIMKGDAKVKEA